MKPLSPTEFADASTSPHESPEARHDRTPWNMRDLLKATGGFLGEETLMGDSVRRHRAIALTRTRVLVIAKAHWLRLLHTQPAITDRFIEHLLTREIRLEGDLIDQLLHPAEQRLVRALLVLAGCDAWRPCRAMLPDISQELIAEIVGTTRSRVNTFIGKFKRVGFIEEDNGRLFVCTSRLPVVCGASRGVAPAAAGIRHKSDRWKFRRYDSSAPAKRPLRRTVIGQLGQPRGRVVTDGIVR